MSRQVLITAIVLTLFALLGGSLVAMTEQSTSAQIAENDRQALLKSLNTIIPPTRYDNDIAASTLKISADQRLGTTTESTVYIASKQGQPVALIFNSIAPDGYSGKIHLLIGIYTDGTIAGTRVVKHRETPGLGDAIEERRSDWILSFDKHSLNTLSAKQWKVKRDGGQFDQFTGATITPRAVVKSVYQTLLYFNENQQPLIKQATANIAEH